MTESDSKEDGAENKPIAVVAGPTASGKSACALDLAREFDGIIINADSMQVYEELRVVTARPSAQEESLAPHRLYGVMSVAAACSAGHWLDRAAAEIRAAWDDDKLPIVCGGTGLYIKALMEGIAPIPDVAADVRAEARRLHGEVGGAAFREKLAVLDADAAERLPAGDSQRLIRAYEIVRATGRTQSDWQAETPVRAVKARFATLALIPDRAVLYPAIDARFLAMMDAGALDEVRALAAMDLDPALPSVKAVGVRELLAYVRGEREREDAVASAQQASRNYAKRQLTWLRTQFASSEFPLYPISAQYSESFRGEIFSFIRQYLLT